ncbi:hypothetical protein [Arcticibacter sp. MXS-1]|uniref:hypothetical protein n=1 Tax=Arcticibacter sp. MXS-1 TaxID=3341726 RepID=UPI0035A90B49
MFSLCKKRGTFLLIGPSLVLVFIVSLGAGRVGLDQSHASWIERCIGGRFYAEEPVKLKRWDLAVNTSGFLRLRKYYRSGKEEYFSFNLGRLRSMVYLGTVKAGYLVFKTKSDDIIVQTYHDRRGDIDTMATSLRLPVVDMEPERLDTLNRYLSVFGE